MKKILVATTIVFGLVCAMSVGYSRAADEQTWLIMLYFDADDETLEEAIFTDVNEAERVGSTDRVQIVAQIDRYPKGFKGDGNWSSAKRFYLDQDNDLSELRSEELVDLGEVSMGDGNTLVDFATWAIKTYPADKYVLIMSDHGMGWPGGWTDKDPNEDSMLFLHHLDEALGIIRNETGIGQFEMVGFDVCLLSHLEVYSAMAPHARYAVASQETEPGVGWAYTAFLEALVNWPEMDGAELAQHIVETYLEQDAAAEEMSPAEVAKYFMKEATLAAIDLSKIPDLMQAFNVVIPELQTLPQELVAEARTYTQTFSSAFGERVPPSYLDLGHFMALLKELGQDQAVNRAADEVLAALSETVIAEKHGPQRPGATGISFYFPNSELYLSDGLPGYAGYTRVANRFATESLWDDFLVFHYTGQTVTPEGVVAVPEAGAEFSSPGAGKIDIAPIQASAEIIGADEAVTLDTDITGDRLGFIYTVAGYYDESLAQETCNGLHLLETTGIR